MPFSGGLHHSYTEDLRSRGTRRLPENIKAAQNEGKMIETGKQLEISSIREELKEFKEKTDAFYAGEMGQGSL